MTKTQYRAALAHLELTQAGFAAFLDISTRSSNAYANGTTIPLPLTNRWSSIRDDDGLGFMLHGVAPLFTVFIGCMFLATDLNTLNAMPVKTYPTIDALMADWRVD